MPPVKHVEPELVDTAKQYYIDLPYHSFDHVRDTLDAAHTLLERCDRYDVAVDATVVEAALLFHDANYHRDHEAQGYGTKEAYSAAIAHDELADYGHTERFRDRVADCIRATEHSKRLERFCESTNASRSEHEATHLTNEAKLVRAADLRNLMQDYGTFRANTEALRREHAVLHDDELPADEWVEQVTGTVEHFLDQEIRLTPGEDGFHERARANLERFRQGYGSWG